MNTTTQFPDISTRFCFAIECGSRDKAAIVHKRYQQERLAWKADPTALPFSMAFFMNLGWNASLNSSVVIASGPDGDVLAAIDFVERLVIDQPMTGLLFATWAKIGPSHCPGSFGGGSAVIDLTGQNATRWLTTSTESVPGY